MNRTATAVTAAADPGVARGESPVGRRRTLAVLLAVLPALASCAAPHGPRVVRLSEADLAATIAGQMPSFSRYVEMFDVTLGTPALTLLPQENRVRMEMPYTLGGIVTNGRKYAGWLQLSHGLRVDPKENAVRLTDVKIERIDIPALPVVHQAMGQRIATLVGGNLLRDLVVYRLREEDVQRAAKYGYRPGAIRVVPGAIELQLDPM